MGKADTESAHRHNRTICLPFSQEVYDACIKNPVDFRIYIDKQIELFPELFPIGIDAGYLMRQRPSFGTAMILKTKLYFRSESEDLSSGAKKITCHLL